MMPKAYMVQELPKLSIQSKFFVLFVRDGLAIPIRKAGGRDTIHGPHKQCGQIGL